MLIRKLGYDGWKKLKYASSRRWIDEIVFSSIKGVLGDLLSKKFSAKKVEAGLKVSFTTGSLACNDQQKL